MALELGLAEAAIIMAVVLEALEALEAGLVTASTSEAAEASSVLVGEDLVGVVALATEEDMGGVAIRIMLNVNCVYVTVL